MRRAAVVFPVHGSPTVRNSVGCLIITPFRANASSLLTSAHAAKRPRRGGTSIAPRWITLGTCRTSRPPIMEATSEAEAGYAAARNSTRTAATPTHSPGSPVGLTSEAIAVLADDRDVRLAVQVDALTAERLHKERVRGEMNDSRSLGVSDVELHAASIAYEPDDSRRLTPECPPPGERWRDPLAGDTLHRPAGSGRLVAREICR